jgi:4-carboxymuconolactone decarboxylase
MKILFSTALLTFGFALQSVCADALAQDKGQTVSPAGSRASIAGPASFFTGNVRITPLFEANDTAPITGGYVSFEPGARSAWHTHPAGQRLVVTSGSGLTQEWGKPVREIRTGDVVWCPPGVKHWHGASPTSAITHLALTGTVNGKNVDWMEKVSEEQYAMAKPALLPDAPSMEDVGRVAPMLESTATRLVHGDLWKRRQLAPRDRSIVTLAALIAGNQMVELPYHLKLALDNGVKPAEISEIITHLAFYSGWANATGAALVTKTIFDQRGIRPEQLPPAGPKLLPIDEAAEAARAQGVERNFGAVAPGVAQLTTELLFRDLWLRPGLAPRDRSLATVSTLIATGQTAQIGYHLNKALDNGLRKTEASEMMTQLAFYAGWPRVFSALPVVKETLEKRAE